MNPENTFHTLLTQEESRGLLLPLTTRDELNREELKNIAKARVWALGPRARHSSRMLTQEWGLLLHKRMFSDVWSWAGEYRTSDKNIGVPYWQVRLDFLNAIEDCKAKLASGYSSQAEADSLILQFAHTIVKIHPFPNGNGRWSRLYADALITSLRFKEYTWGGLSESGDVELRDMYVAALRRADSEYNVDDLISFARS